MGLSERAAVQVTVGAAHGGYDNAWMQFVPAHDGVYRFTTYSDGPDPVLQVLVGGCGQTRTTATNDDAIGLDASLAVTLQRGELVLVHVTNSGEGGPLAVDVASSDTSIAGTVTDAVTGQPIVNASVAAVSTTLYYTYIVAYTDVNGHYLIALNPGSYYLSASENDYVSELYPNAQCQYTAYYNSGSACNTAQATVLSPISGQAITGIDVALGHGQQIAGAVRNNANQPITSASVSLYTTSGQQLDYTYTDSVGRYSFATVAPSFAYKLEARAGGYGAQMYDHVACGGPLQDQCDLSQATPLSVTNQDQLDVNFSPPLLATIQGTVSGPSQYGTQVCVVDSAGNPATYCTSTDGNGHYSAGPLAVGTFYAYASAMGYFSQIYNGIDCPHDCTQSIASASAITISQPGQVGSANFALKPLPTVHGHVQDAISGLPLPNVTVYASILPPAYNGVANTTTDSNGNYALTNAPAGTYYLLAVSNDHVDQIYSGIPCEQYNSGYYYPNTACDVTGAALLTIAPGQTPPVFDFALAPSSAISGAAIVRAGPGSDIPASNVEVDVYNTAAQIVASTTSDALGAFVVNDLVAGIYYAEAGSSNYYYASYVDQVWDHVDCPTVCAPMSGTPIAVGSNVTVPGIDFDLTRHDAVVGRIRDDAGKPLGGVIVDLFDATSSQYSGSGISDALGFYSAIANMGASYFVATEVGTGYVNQVYDDIACPLGAAYFGKCAFTGATAVGLGSNSVQPRIVGFTIYANDTIFAGGFDD